MLYIDAAFFQSHRLLQIAHTPDAFLVSILTHSDIEYLRIFDPQDLFREGGHSQHIVIRMHRIVSNIALDQFDHSSADKIFICHSFHRRKDQRMMRDQHVCTCFDRPVNDCVRCIQCKIHPVHFLPGSPGKKSYIVKIQRRTSGISRLNNLHNFFTLHNSPSLSLLFSVLLPVPVCVVPP